VPLSTGSDEAKPEVHAVVAEIADRTASNELIKHHLHNKIIPGSQQRKQNGHVITKARYNKQLKFLNFRGGSFWWE